MKVHFSVHFHEQWNIILYFRIFPSLQEPSSDITCGAEYYPSPSAMSADAHTLLSEEVYSHLQCFSCPSSHLACQRVAEKKGQVYSATYYVFLQPHSLCPMQCSGHSALPHRIFFLFIRIHIYSFGDLFKNSSVKAI